MVWSVEFKQRVLFNASKAYMEKEAAAIDTREPLDNFTFKSSITRSDMLFMTFGSSIDILLVYFKHPNGGHRHHMFIA